MARIVYTLYMAHGITFGEDHYGAVIATVVELKRRDRSKPGLAFA